jgi:hypothetical protein
MSKLDTLQLRNDINFMTTKFHNHWMNKIELSNFAKIYPLTSKS